jgi:hypothetical protein
VFITVVVEEFVDEIHVRENHASATVAVQPQFRQGVPAGKPAKHRSVACAGAAPQTENCGMQHRAHPSLMSAWR